jgi:signal transduction histidine kinase
MKSRLANIGESVTNISHQWKQPLNELGIQLMLIENTLENDFLTEKDKTKIKNITEKSHNILEFMANTVDVFGNLLKADNKITTFHPQKIIQELLQLVNDNFKIHGINVTSELDKDIHLTGNSTELTHILLSILINARDIIVERKINNPHLKIRLYKSSDNIYIDVIDNAGGIKTSPVENIFKFGFSNKKTNESGLGLFIAKQLIENKFSGTIHAENSNDGATFKISIPYRVKKLH